MVGNLEFPDPRSIFDYEAQNTGDKQALLIAVEEFNFLADEIVHLTND
jgi:hypothetical protein